MVSSTRDEKFSKINKHRISFPLYVRFKDNWTELQASCQNNFLSWKSLFMLVVLYADSESDPDFKIDPLEVIAKILKIIKDCQDSLMNRTRNSINRTE
jgi:hypothetical protein